MRFCFDPDNVAGTCRHRIPALDGADTCHAPQAEAHRDRVKGTWPTCARMRENSDVPAAGCRHGVWWEAKGAGA